MIELPPGAVELHERRKQKIEDQLMAEAVLEKQIPRPVGYKVLIALPEAEETFRGTNLAKAEVTKKHETILSMVGIVLDMGEQAYTDLERFPTGAWCKKGDYVLFRANSGTRFKVGGQELRLLNDDSIEAIVVDHTGIERI